MALAIVVSLLEPIAPECAAQAGKKSTPPDAILELLRNLAPAERMAAVTKVAKKSDFEPATRGDIVNTITERGNLDAIQTSDIIARAQGLAKGPLVISWVVDDGTAVKKDEKVLEFDKRPYIDALVKLRVLINAAQANFRKADEQLKRVQKETGIEIKLAEIDVRLAELVLQQYKGNDDAQKQVLRLQVDRASLLLERVKLQSDTIIEKGNAEAQAKKAVLEPLLAQTRELENDLDRCVLRAPHDGMVVYHIPERTNSRVDIVAVGEPVREGQKLIRICDLKQMRAIVRVPEAMIAKLRIGQEATVRVDAYPKKTFTGKVATVANVADQSNFFNKGIKVYQITIAIDVNNDALRPGMSAEATIVAGQRLNCLRVPVTAILTNGKINYCYVQAGKELQMRELKLGLADSVMAEVIDGLKEGETVLRSPFAVADRLLK